MLHAVIKICCVSRVFEKNKKRLLHAVWVSRKESRVCRMDFGNGKHAK